MNAEKILVMVLGGEEGSVYKVTAYEKQVDMFRRFKYLGYYIYNLGMKGIQNLQVFNSATRFTRDGERGVMESENKLQNTIEGKYLRRGNRDKTGVKGLR